MEWCKFMLHRRSSSQIVFQWFPLLARIQCINRTIAESFLIVNHNHNCNFKNKQNELEKERNTHPKPRKLVIKTKEIKNSRRSLITRNEFKLGIKKKWKTTKRPPKEWNHIHSLSHSRSQYIVDHHVTRNNCSLTHTHILTHSRTAKRINCAHHPSIHPYVTAIKND